MQSVPSMNPFIFNWSVYVLLLNLYREDHRSHLNWKKGSDMSWGCSLNRYGTFCLWACVCTDKSTLTRFPVFVERIKAPKRDFHSFSLSLSLFALSWQEPYMMVYKMITGTCNIETKNSQWGMEGKMSAANSH